MEDYVREINQRLVLLETPTKVVDWYHSTGNFVVQSPKTNRWAITDELSLALGVSCIVQTIDEVASCASIADKIGSPQSQADIRWTKGIVFKIKGKPCTVALKPTPRVVFFNINRFAVGVYKADPLTNQGDLDMSDRSAGWEAISDVLSKQVGGLWTARSLVRIEGVIKKAREHMARKHT